MVDAEDRHDDPENMKKQLPHPTNGSASPNSTQDGAATGSQKEPASQSVSLSLSGDGAAYIPDTQHQVQTLYNRGFDSSTGEWDDYSHYTNPKGLEVASPGVYNDNPSVVFHAGYGYGPHMPYGPYSPVTTPLPSIGGDAQLFSSQQFPYSGQPFYQQLVPPTMPYITSPTQASQADLTLPMNADQQDQVIFGPSPNYPSPVGSFGRGAFPGNPWTIGFHDQQQGLDGLSSGGLWSGWSKPTDRQRSFPPLSPAVSPQPIGIGSFAQNAGIASEHQRTFSGYGSADPYNRDYLHSGITAGASFGSSSIPGLGMNGQGWVSLDGRRRRWRTGGATCSCNGTPDILIDQNRGPRASKPKTLATSEHSYSIEDNKLSTSAAKMNGGSYNQADFITEYKDARFFVIKSYSEDNVHKSIKYGVWASTPNGNRKLDAAYREAKENKDVCPVFLFFSVNASAQFCGVAEMVGPVDFDTSFDYWQQDRWSGKFPVKWHIIKDVPNSQLRHIVLENNDNKPVTNSRDTQEVKLEQGIEMLNIFKNYDANTSILDDFEFYEGREKVIQEGKARQQASSPVVGPVVKNEQRTPVKLSSDFIDKMSKSFGQVVCFDEYGKEETVADIASSARDNATGSGIDFQVSTA